MFVRKLVAVDLVMYTTHIEEAEEAGGVVVGCRGVWGSSRQENRQLFPKGGF